MAFGYEYLMVYLPAFNPRSFLLFVHNPAGSTKLRDYSGGQCKVVGQPSLQAVVRATVGGKTRFSCDPHATADESYWSTETLDLNARYLTSPENPTSEFNVVQPQFSGAKQLGTTISGRAHWGSQRQLQDYVNGHEEVLTRAVMEAIPPRFGELGASIKWVSPLAQDNYTEYRDGDFLRAVGLGDFVGELESFWPSGGPCWDALGIVSDLKQRMKPNIVLVEAKSHLAEIYGSGCQAGVHSRELIAKSLGLTKVWCNAVAGDVWTGPLYQSANRLAHLYFIRERLNSFAWLVNLCFINDPIGPADRVAWEAELTKVKVQLGINSPVPFVINVFLPALDPNEPNETEKLAESTANSWEKSPSTGTDEGALRENLVSVKTDQVATALEAGSFAAWANRWMALAVYPGGSVPDSSSRIEQLLSLWQSTIPGVWQRGLDQQLLGPCYRRGDFNAPNPGEHTIEHEILCRRLNQISCLGHRILDGINALPLVCDACGGRSSNVEADLLLLGEHNGKYRLFLCEVKDRSNDPWYAAVESLRQLRLFLSSPESLRLFSHRNNSGNLPHDIPITTLVLAPNHFYASPGKKANAVIPALELIARFNSVLSLDIRLDVLNGNEIKEWGNSTM